MDRLTKRGVSPRIARSAASYVYILVAILTGAGLLGKTDLIRHILPVPAALTLALIVVGLALPAFWFVLTPARMIIGIAALLGLCCCSLLIFPKVEKMHTIGRGSDQPDCVIIASRQMARLRWPYDSSRMWSRNPMSCGPGWVAMQAPVVDTAGYGVSLAFFDVLSGVVLVLALGSEQGLMVLFLCALSPGFWLTAADGTDFLTFGLIVAALQALATRSRRSSLWLGLLAGFVAQFRAVTLLLPSLQGKLIGKRAAIAGSALAIACQLGFFLWNPASYVREGPMHLFQKLTGEQLSARDALYLAIAATLAAGILVWIILRIVDRVDPNVLLLSYLSLVIALPALLDIVVKLKLYGAPLRALGFWEGSNWMSALLPLSALLLVQKYAGVQPTEAPQVTPHLVATD